jgi:hypothetical protein
MIEESNTHQEVNDKFADKLSPAAYAKKQIFNLVVQAGSAVAGYFAGKGIGGMLKNPGKELLYPESGYSLTKQKAYAWGGAFVGLMVSGIALMYGHWKNQEGARLAVKELNNDVGNMVAIRAKTNPDLVKENDTLHEMYDQLKTENIQMRQTLEAKGIPIEKRVQQIVENGPKTPMDQAMNPEPALSGRGA